ncbi:MAG: VTT domain-containing protein [Desulfovibrio sp.]|jgi:uncharacterized membrane protein YdjX (TVP38/TMEM64 family)|nr:VTT domain-containing protein [Desulfovibrio sp.]
MSFFHLPSLPQAMRKAGDQAHPSHSRLLHSTIKLGVLFLTLAGIGFFAHIFNLEDVLDPTWANSHLRDPSRETFTGGGILLYMLLVTLLSPLGVPRQALSALGGYAFGALFGVIFSSIGLIAGCSGAFFYSRLLARSFLQRRFGGRIQRLDAFLAHSPFIMTIAIRCFPIGNNALTNLAAGLTGIPASSFIGGSAIGYLPQTVIFALLGSGIRIAPLWRTTLSAILLIASSLLGFLLYRRFKGNQIDN